MALGPSDYSRRWEQSDGRRRLERWSSSWLWVRRITRDGGSNFREEAVPSCLLSDAGFLTSAWGVLGVSAVSAWPADPNVFAATPNHPRNSPCEGRRGDCPLPA